MAKLTRLLNEVVIKWKHLKKQHQGVLVNSLEKAIWNWLDTYPDEFKDLQNKPNADLSDNCEKLFEHLDQFYEKQKGIQKKTIFFRNFFFLNAESSRN
jgi:neurofibromin 1